MITHVTGCDGVGKSTLVESLSKNLSYPSRHFDKPKDMKDGKNQYFNFVKGNRKNWICDRLHDGEWVYAPLYRGYMANYMQEFERALIKNNNYVLIYVKAELETIIERTRKRGEDFVKEEHFQTVLNYFDGYLNKQKMPFIVVDTTNATIGAGVNKAQDATDKVNKIWNMIRDFNTNVPKMNQKKKVFPRGNVDAEYMLVTSVPTLWAEQQYYTMLSEEPNANDIIELAKLKGIDGKTWYTSLLSFPTIDGRAHEKQIEATKHIIKYQYDLLKPKKVVVIDNRTKEQLSKILPGVEILTLGNL